MTFIETNLRPPRGLARKILSLGLASLVALPLSAADFNFDPYAPEPVSAKTAGMGGPFTTQITGFDTLLTNPAGLAYVDKTWSIARIAMHAAGPLFDLPAVLMSDDITGGILDLVAENNGIYIGSGVTGPLAFGMVDRNFGAGIFSDTNLVVNIPSLTRASIVIDNDFLLTGAYGLTVYEKEEHSLALGLQLKGYIQNFMIQQGTALEIMDIATSMNPSGIPLMLSTGFGLDTGLMYRYGSLFSAAILCRNLLTPAFTTHYANLDDYLSATPDADTQSALLPIELSAGVGFSVPLPDRWQTVTSWNVMLDYRNALEILEPLYRNPILNVGIGTELVLLDVVSLRAGIHETYLATGLGLDLTFCKLDFALYGSELGLDPGVRPLLNMDLSLSFEY